MEIIEAITFLDSQIPNSEQGLPEEIFLFASTLMPMVNVDLLIKDEQGRTLLSWRDDKYCGKGWHIPGGIIRFKETMHSRIMKVAELEIGNKIEYEPNPIAINEIILEQNTRGHFISFLYKCFLQSTVFIDNKELKETDAGFLKWHKSCPCDLLEMHELYRKYM